MATNKEIAEAFAAQFDPPLQVVHTQQINNVPVKDAYTCSFYDVERELGVMCVVHRGVIKAYLEGAGVGRSYARWAGSVLSRAMMQYVDSVEK